MANIYDVNAAIAKPNVLDSFRTGQQYGMRLREQQQAQQDEQALRGLAPQVVAGDPQAYERAAAIDPQAAGQYDAANVNMAKRAAGAAAYMLDAVKRGNPQEIQGRYNAVLPFLTKLGAAQGKTPPPQFDPAMVPAMEQLVASAQGMGGAQNETPAGFQELHMKALAAGLQPGTPGYERAMRIALGTEAGLARTQPKVITTDINGTPTTLTFDPATQSYRIAELSGPQPGVPSYAPVAGDETASIEQEIGRPLTEQEQAQIAAGTFNLQARGPGGMPITGRRKEDEAAAVTAAQEAAKLQFLPQQLGMQTQAGIAEATGKAEAEARVKRDADLATAAQKKYVDATTTLSLLDEAEPLLKQATGSGLGAARDVAAATFGQSTEGARAIAALNPIAASLTLAVPRMEGPQSDADRLLYQKAAGDFANPQLPAETKLAALQQMRRLANKYRLSQGRPPAPRETQSPASDIDALLDKYR